ncbi:hypothetical protein TELCIR_13953 [Teladorsagia circumcincta]|uniref:Endonuclease/exonuclease/phosphatase domain-containing protein n=1 Tax=Teladorsagia circumcincta TaxID=45464 RepID=A0A2G9U2P5_TELCI|nr:hypothetical protein TELCIR_13953 [Teladorsagia circumcincta]
MLTASLSRDVQITVIQVYAPIADSDEEEHDDFYEQLEELIRRERSYVVVMGDFNARIGSRRAGEVYIGPHSAEEHYCVKGMHSEPLKEVSNELNEQPQQTRALKERSNAYTAPECAKKRWYA